MFGVWGLGFGVWGWGLGCGWWVGVLYVHTLVKNLLIKFLMMLFLVAKGCKFDSCIVHIVFVPTTAKISKTGKFM